MIPDPSTSTISVSAAAVYEYQLPAIEGLTDDTYFTLTTAPAHGTATNDLENGNWTYTPKANYFGNDAFQVTVTDDLQGTTSALLQITINPIDDPATITLALIHIIRCRRLATGASNAVAIHELTHDTYFTFVTAPTHRTASIHPESATRTYTPYHDYF